MLSQLPWSRLTEMRLPVCTISPSNQNQTSHTTFRCSKMFHSFFGWYLFWQIFNLKIVLWTKKYGIWAAFLSLCFGFVKILFAPLYVLRQLISCYCSFKFLVYVCISLFRFWKGFLLPTSWKAGKRVACCRAP